MNSSRGQAHLILVRPPILRVIVAAVSLWTLLVRTNYGTICLHIYFILKLRELQAL